MPYRHEANMALLIELHQDHNRELRVIHNSLGGIEQQLVHGRQVHIDLQKAVTHHGSALRDLHTRTASLESVSKPKAKSEPVSLKDWTEFLKAFWPYLFVVSIVASKVFLGSVEPVTRFVEHLTQK